MLLFGMSDPEVGMSDPEVGMSDPEVGISTHIFIWNQWLPMSKIIKKMKTCAYLLYSKARIENNPVCSAR